MQCFLLLLLLVLLSGLAQAASAQYRRSFINRYPRFAEYNDGGDPGPPLYLTPLIHNASLPRGKVQQMARVVGSQFHGVESYAGYLTVDVAYNSNLFFWYFPAEESPAYAPVVLWLQGGPGASSMFGLFTENGPFEFDGHGHLRKRNFTWSRTHNLIFIDNPVGTGFSFTDNEDGYAKNEKDVGRNLHEAVMQLYMLFEWSNSSGFWVTGESYAGKYVPALAFHIHNHQNAIETDAYIPLKGVAIGNGFTDPVHQLNYGDYLYQLGLIDTNGLRAFQKAEAQAENLIKQHDMAGAFDLMDWLIDGDQTNSSLFKNLTGYEFYYNYLKTQGGEEGEVLGKFLQSTETRRAIHVGNKTFHDLDKENKVEQHLKLDVMDTVAPWLATLLDNYKVCIYSGQLDIIVAYPLTRNYLEKLKFKGADEYLVAPREIWRLEGQVAGYIKRGGHLVEVLVRNAGHMAPTDQPQVMYELIERLTHEKL